MSRLVIQMSKSSSVIGVAKDSDMKLPCKNMFKLLALWKNGNVIYVLKYLGVGRRFDFISWFIAKTNHMHVGIVPIGNFIDFI